MTTINVSALSNGSTSPQNAECDVFDDSLLIKAGKILAVSIILLSSLAGNILIVVTVYKREELKKTINYFIVNMAISDVVYSLSDFPVSLQQIVSSSRVWYLDGTVGVIFCKLTKYLEHVSISVSVASLIWIALDRFVAVVVPMKAHVISEKFRKFAIASTWILAMVINWADLYTYVLTEKNRENTCEHVENAVFSYMNNGKVHIYVFHIAPLITLTILYCGVVVVLRRQDRVLSSRASVHHRDKRKRQAIKMSLCIMAAFCICSLPMTILNAVSEYKITMPCTFYKPFWFICYLLFFLSSAINPIICFVFVGSYRRSFTEMFKKSGVDRKDRQQEARRKRRDDLD